MGGKTGTGDNRGQLLDDSGRPVGSTVLNRTATFVFFVGDRHFGTLTAFVNGPAAAHYRFTSSLATQVMKVVAPHLLAVIERNQRPAPAWTRGSHRQTTSTCD